MTKPAKPLIQAQNGRLLNFINIVVWMRFNNDRRGDHQILTRVETEKDELKL